MIKEQHRNTIHPRYLLRCCETSFVFTVVTVVTPPRQERREEPGGNVWEANIAKLEMHQPGPHKVVVMLAVEKCGNCRNIVGAAPGY